MSSSEPPKFSRPLDPPVAPGGELAGSESSLSTIFHTDSTTLWVNHGFQWLVKGIAVLTIVVLGWMGWIIYEKAQIAIKTFGLGFLTSQEWDVPGLIFGALPYIYGTLVTSALALLLALPISIAVALVTSERLIPAWARSPVAFVIELIAAIPSVIVGLWGIYVLIPVLQPLQLWLYEAIGKNPFFSKPPLNLVQALFAEEPFGPSMFVAGVILTIMILPTIAAISREVLLAVPNDLRVASESLGATRWETIFRVILPAGISGIIGAAMLGLGRALGETMAVVMVIGNTARISPSLLGSGYTIPAVLANEFAEAQDDLHIGALMYLALILFVLTLVVNIAARLIVRLISFKPG